MKKYLAIIAAVGLVVILLVGCSGGDKGTKPKVSAQQEYQALKPDIDTMVAGVLDYLTTGINRLRDFESGNPTPPRLLRMASDADTGMNFNYVYQNGWHIVSASLELDSIQIAMAESLRFTDAQGAPQQTPDSTTTSGLHLVTHVAFSSDYHALNGSLTDYVNFTFSGFQSPTVSVNGAGRFGMDMSGSDTLGAYAVDLGSTVDMNQVSVSNPYKGGNGCPRAGTADLHLDGSFSGHDDDGTAVSGDVTASVAITFQLSGSADVTVDIANTQFNSSVNACPHH